MSRSTRKHWLLAYDISDPKRLRRIHAYMSKCAWPLQYSVFGLEMSELRLRDVLDDLGQLMDPTRDDIRVYHLPQRCKVWTLGRGPLADGVEMNASVLLELLNREPSAPKRGKPSPTTPASTGRHNSFSPRQANPNPRSNGN